MSRKYTLLLSSALVTALIATPVAAQEYEDEIITTATKRQQTLQETPVAVSVTPAEVIENAKILDIGDLQSVVPSLRVTQLQSSANTNFIIRGFGNGANNAGIEPSVGVFVDGVYRSRSAAQIGDLPKLQRVEVLNGPQNTLFGKNASAGVISVVSAAPSFDQQGYVEGGITNYNGYLLKGYYTNALSENTAFSIGGGLTKRDGYVDAFLPGVPDSNDRNRFNLRGQLLIEPSDRTTIRLIGDYSEIDEICCAVTNFQNAGAAAAVTALGGRAADANDPFAYVHYVNKPGQNKVDDWGLSAHVDIDFDKFTLTSISAYRENDYLANYDADYNTLLLLENVNIDQSVETFTQEVRLTSPGGEAIDWMVGGFFFKEDVVGNGGIKYGNQLRPYIDILAGSPAILGTIEAVNGETPGTYFGPQVRTTELFEQDNTTYSIFGNVDFNISDRLTATIGANYTNDEKDVTGRTINNDRFSDLDLATNPATLLLAQGAIVAAFGNPADPIYQAFLGATNAPLTAATVAAFGGLNGPALTPFVAGVRGNVVTGLQPLQFQPQFVDFPNSVESGNTNDDNVSYTLRLAYEVNDDVNVYGSYATGFKSSSWNLSRDSRPFPRDQAAIEAAGLDQNNQTYTTRYAGPEEAKVFEVGMKTKFDMGSFNITAFTQTIEGFQSNTFLGTGFALANAGEQKTNGVEFDTRLIPNEHVLFTFAGTFLDPQYESFVNAPQGDLSGTQVPGVPEVSLATSITFNNEFTNGMTWFLRGDHQYESEVQVVGDIATAATQPERTINQFNFAGGLGFNNGIDLQVFVRNAFNDEYFLSAFPGVAQAGVVQAYPNQPRTYGMTVRKNF
ncbi:TonB-dependent receptor [Robiginitomaculum antarcticum]|uniref:TonB-dependent receptor n=1 Tax=Robiginitomaculum antarcticum TaxID=437507 RepID=UPI00037FC99C|nr:TonB-dependent receptor [Robiginitomaculum antarcticum]